MSNEEKSIFSSLDVEKNASELYKITIKAPFPKGAVTK